MARTVVLTRPLPVHDGVLDALNRASVDVLQLPTLAVTAHVDDENEKRLKQNWANYAGVMFVSQHAATFAAQRLNELGLSWRGAWAAAVGQASAQSILRHWPRVDLVTPAQDDTQDSDGLWHSLAREGLIESNKNVLIVRAQVGRDSLMQRLQQSGMNVDIWPCYRREVLVWTPEQQRDFCQAQSANGVVLAVTSAEGLAGLLANVPEADWPLLHQQKVVTLHPAIAQAAKEKGFLDVTVVPAASMAASLIEQSLRVN